MILYGAGGHAKVIIDCLLSQGEAITCIFDIDEHKSSLLGLEVIHGYSSIIHPEQQMIVAIGDNTIRREVVNNTEHAFGNAYHDSAMISPMATIDEGTVVFHYAIVQTGSRIGKHVIINTGASVDHDCVVHDYVHIAPHATLCGAVHVGEGSMIGANATIIPGIHIGKWAIVGAGAVVVSDVPDFAVVVGNPAKVVKKRNID